ncbi:unnamed protein product (macronuclear) [Paramecium tetraurelia]|uniref:Uncharacterized protein n=1 Tax=Paramecium tetraurelia TaxID=5888 RepID=A0BHX8_PARTE|nr:uncharacterized protein GSPATT00029181001 [Paramecium tetraurelia]CAK58145.1 unnamed protein product [Paramecium tetraurelia]|eukprot:XP_001425543.1 hypothetical protein (macronuclear) [Paramecium tetraurelia strain d4-2]
MKQFYNSRKEYSKQSQKKVQRNNLKLDFKMPNSFVKRMQKRQSITRLIQSNNYTKQNENMAESIKIKTSIQIDYSLLDFHII